MMYLPWAFAAAVLLGGPTAQLSVVLAPQFRGPDVDSVRIVADYAGKLSIPMSPKNGMALFNLATDRAWKVTCESSEFWCPELEVSVASSNRILLPVTERSLLKGKLRTVPSTELPVSLHAQGWVYLPDEPQPLSLLASVTVDEGRFELSVPAVPLDLRLVSEGFSPVYFWDVAAQANAVLDLGTVQLKPGSSLCGFVNDESTGLPLKSAEVVVRVPPLPVGSPSLSVKRIQRMTWKTHTNVRGFYQIFGLPEGNYRLEVKSDDPEHQPLVVKSFGMLAEAETCLEDLAVKRAMEVSFTLSPSQDPEGEPWQVRLTPSGHGDPVKPSSTVAADETGWALFRVSPGLHDLVVVDGAGSKVLRRSIELESPMEIPLALEMVRVKGTILLGEEALVARINLSGHEGANIIFESDYEGHFSGWMRDPRGRTLVAEVSAAFPPFSRWLEIDDYTVTDGVLLLDLSFEDRVLEGTVTDERGNPIRMAEVSAVPVGSRMPIKSSTEVDGSFRLMGLAEKPYLIRAKDDDLGISETVRVDPWGDGTGPQLTLVLRRGRSVYGRLTSAELVPVPGARVALLVPGGNPGRPSASTGIDGRFEIRVPEGAQHAVVQVFAASQVLWSACVELPVEDRELSLRLPPLPGGRFILRIPGTRRLAADHQLAIVSAEGGLFRLTDIVNWVYPSTGHNPGGRGSPEGDRIFEVPHLASGLYTAVWTSAADLAAGSCAGTFSTADWQYLTPGGELSLTATPSPRPKQTDQ